MSHSEDKTARIQPLTWGPRRWLQSKDVALELAESRLGRSPIPNERIDQEDESRVGDAAFLFKDLRVSGVEIVPKAVSQWGRADSCLR
jgi:hypothetical protein